VPWAKPGLSQFSNTDNMALVGVLSTQLLDRDLLRASRTEPRGTVQTVVDRLAASDPTDSVVARH
jgi:hypothetical protein